MMKLDDIRRHFRQVAAYKAATPGEPVKLAPARLLDLLEALDEGEASLKRLAEGRETERADFNAALVAEVERYSGLLRAEREAADRRVAGVPELVVATVRERLLKTAGITRHQRDRILGDIEACLRADIATAGPA
jgi:hypothetical protein